MAVGNLRPCDGDGSADLGDLRTPARWWRADTGKTGRESIVPIDAEARVAIDRQLARRPIVGAAYLFPSPTEPNQPVSRHLANAWLRKAEALAKVEP